jgi:hypothetical protein
MKWRPECGSPLKVLLCMGVIPDGYVCTHGGLYLNEALHKVARAY